MSQIDQFTLKDDVEYIKIHGLQRSGTNYIASLIDSNFRAKSLINVGGWKHGHYCAPWVLGKEVHVLSIVKNPYSWLVSMYEYWKQNDVGEDLSEKTFEQFVKSKSIFERSAGNPYLLLAANPVWHWNCMNFHWMSILLNQKISLMIPYEALLLDFHDVLDSIADSFNLNKSEVYKNEFETMKPGEENCKKEGMWERKNYYLNREYLNNYNSDILEFVNLNLDKNLMNVLGYELV